tara:strand:+ start:1624 stop:5385 length:3762 start_codon:yes stop_codon:yes gene_type:complete
MSEVQKDIQLMKDSGFNPTEIENYKKEQITIMEGAGFANDEILGEFGVKPIDTSSMDTIYDEYIGLNEELLKPVYEQIKEAEERDDRSLYEKAVGKGFDQIGERIKAAWNTGVVDLIQSQYNIPNIDGTDQTEKYFNLEFEDTGFLERNITNASRIVKDLPLYIGIGYATKPFSIFGAGYGVGSIRETFLTMREKGQVGTFGEFWDAYRKHGIKAGLKEGLQLSMASRFGRLSNKFIPSTLLQVTGFEGTGAAIERKLPSAEQLTDSVILFGSFGLASRGAAKAKSIITKTPYDAVDLSTLYKLDENNKQDMSSLNLEIPRTMAKLVEKQTGQKIKIDADFTKGLDMSKVVTKFLTKVKFEKPKDKAELKDLFTRLFIDRLHPLRRIVQRVENVKNTSGRLNIYEAFRVLVGMTNRAGAFITRGTLRARDLEVTGKSFNDILQPLRLNNLQGKIEKGFLGKENIVQGKKANEKTLKKQYAELASYLIARRVVEYSERGFESGFKLKEAKEVMKELKPKYDKIAKEIDVYQRQLLEYARDLGLIDKGAFNAMIEANKSYVPFARILEAMESGKETGYTKIVQNPFKRVQGGKAALFDPIETIYSNTFRIVKLAERNNSLNKFFDFVEKNKKVFPDINKLSQRTELKVERSKLEQILDNPSEVSNSGIINLNVFTKEFMRSDSNTVQVFRNGKLETWEVGRDLAQALAEFTPSEMGVVTRVLGLPARTLRAGATTSPDFIFSNIARDTVLAPIFSKSGFIPGWNTLKGAYIMAAAKTGFNKNAERLFKLWEKSGGMQSTLMSLDRNIFDKPVYDQLTGRTIRNQIKNPLEILRTLSEIGENITRLGEFQLAYKKAGREGLKGRERAERAGFETRDVTIDYAKMGYYMKGLNQVSAFYNARVQGYVKIYEAIRDRPGRAATAIAAGIVIPSLYFWYANKDSEIYRRQPKWVKDNYWVVVMDEGTEDARVYRIPKPFDLGVVFGTGTEQFLDYVASDHPESIKNGKEFALDFIVNQMKNLNPIPTILTPALETYMNKSFFTGNPIVPYYMESQLLSPYQYNPYTTETSKLISRSIMALFGDNPNYTASPLIIENWIRGWTGGLGNYLLMALDKALVTSGVIDDPIKPKDSLTKIPGIRAFNLRDPSIQSEFITDFYTQYNQVKKFRGTIDFLVKTNDKKEAIKVAKQLEKVKIKQVVLERNKKTIDEVTDGIRKIHNMKDLNPQEKQESIDKLVLRTIQIAKESLEGMYGIPQKDNK